MKTIITLCAIILILSVFASINTYKMELMITKQESKIASLISHIEEMQRAEPWLLLLRSKLTKRERLELDGMVERIKQND